jgi:hypothetical protein
VEKLGDAMRDALAYEGPTLIEIALEVDQEDMG